jgi:hypothetical protein
MRSPVLPYEAKVAGLASLQHTITRQELHILWLSEGDTSTKFFHVHANPRQRWKFIHSLQHDVRSYVEEDQKAQLAFSYFDCLLGTPVSHDRPRQIGSATPRPVSLGGVLHQSGSVGVIRTLPPDKAPDHDGFTACFLQSAWPIIRPDMMKVFDTFWRLDLWSLHSVNEALMELLPKSS